MQNMFNDMWNVEDEFVRYYFVRPVRNAIMQERVQRANMNWFTDFNNGLDTTNSGVKKPNRKQCNVTFAEDLVHYSNEVALKRQTSLPRLDDDVQASETTESLQDTNKPTATTLDCNPEEQNHSLNDNTSAVTTTSGNDVIIQPGLDNDYNANRSDNESLDVIEEIVVEIVDGFDNDKKLDGLIMENNNIDDPFEDVALPLSEMNRRPSLQAIDETDEINETDKIDETPNEMEIQIASPRSREENCRTFHFKYEENNEKPEAAETQADVKEAVDDANTDVGRVISVSSSTKQNCGQYISEEGGPMIQVNTNYYHPLYIPKPAAEALTSPIASSDVTIPANDNAPVMKKIRFKPPTILKLESKLNGKACCQHKCSDQKLPKYTGYFSEYGLSHDQLMARETHLQRRRRTIVEQALKSNEQELRRMHENERAFTKWLQNKIRYPVNTTRNMFDARRPFGQHKFSNRFAKAKAAKHFPSE